MFLKILQIHRKTPVLESLFNKVASVACNFVKDRLRCRCFPVKFVLFLRTSVVTEHLSWLFLKNVELIAHLDDESVTNSFKNL